MIADIKIDLTENRDFSGGLFDRSFLTADSDTINRAISIRNNEVMSNEEFELLLQYEKLFGVKVHNSEVNKVFKISEEDYQYDMKTHCQRCGKEFRLPWKNYYGLCKECNEASPYKYYNIPWKHIQIVRIGGFDDARDIFNLR